MINNGRRLTGVRNSELIEDVSKLQTVLENMISEPSRWVFATKLNWLENGLILQNDVIVVTPNKLKANSGGVIKDPIQLLGVGISLVAVILLLRKS